MSKQWKIVESVETDEGRLDLKQRGEDSFLITINNRILMNSWANTSEIVLAESACALLEGRKHPRVLLAGLGMGFTLKAAMDALPADAEVVVAELNPVVVAWCRGPMAHLTSSVVDDPRVTVVVDDVITLIRDASKRAEKNRFDAIILDLYEGPFAGERAEGAYLWGAKALAMSRSALKDDGVYAVWSEEPDAGFERRLGSAKFSVKRHRPGRGRGSHVVYIARKSGT